MNERYVFVIAAFVAELSASSLFFAANPSSPLSAAAMGLLPYAVQHLSMAVVIWLLLGVGVWIYNGSQHLRLRQSPSSKLSFLAKLGLAGVFIDNAVSIYQLEDSSEAITRSASTAATLGDLAERTFFYGIGFSAVVGVSFLIGSRRRPTVTPPPRFGRE
jgi:hypothetical protein